jgi:hypothetical protein
MFGLRPYGGSFVSLIDFSNSPIGISSLGSDDKNNLKLGFEPSIANASSFFSSSFKKEGIRCTFCNITQ